MVGEWKRKKGMILGSEEVRGYSQFCHLRIGGGALFFFVR